MRKLGAYQVYLFLSGTESIFFTLVFTVSMIYQVSVVHLNPFQLLLVGTVLETACFIAQIPTGIVADTYSRRWSIIFGIALIGLGFLVFGLFPTFAATLSAQVLWGIGVTFTDGATEAWISDEIGEKAANQAFLRGNQFGQIGGLIGLVISVGLGSILLNLPILLGGGLFLVLAAVLILVMPENGFKPTSLVVEEKRLSNIGQTMRSSFQVLKHRPTIITILVIAAIFGAFSESYDRLWTPHFLDDITLPTWGNLPPVVWFGLLSVLGTIVSAILTGWLHKRTDTNSHQKVARALLTINALLMATVIVFSLTNNFVIAVIVFEIIGPLRGVRGPLSTAWLNQRLDPKVRATIHSVGGLADACGQIIGGPIIGLLATLTSIPIALVAGALMLVPALVLYARTLNHHEPTFEPLLEEPVESSDKLEV